ncbi:MAG: glycosyltransferase family 2 protein [Candidatus Cryptobacteroides sp.]|nr:glycosyltransferase [Bacteroidales bacterium]
MQQKAAILLTVHNRRIKTLECLKVCYQQIDAMKAEGEYAFKVYMVDDGSTDGTSEAVKETFPQTVVIRGSGGLFWNQGMRLAWEKASEDDPDFYLWINDDTVLYEGAIACLMETSSFLRHRAIVVGTAESADGKLSYGGRTKYGKIVEPDTTLPVTCQTFNGNLVLIPHYVFRLVGNLDEHYQHSFGDYDYGVRAGRLNIVCVVAPGVLCRCDRNPGVPKWKNRQYPLSERIASLRGPKGRPPKEQFLYDCRSRSIVFAIAHYTSIFLQVLFPRKYNDNE